METGHHRDQWENTFRPCVLLLLILISPINCIVERNNTHPPSCKENEYLGEAGFCCDRCSPGFKLVKQCTAEGQRSVCEKCGPGTFQDAMNFYGNCFSCKSCSHPFAFTKRNCTHDQDAQCECEDGYYMPHIDTNTDACYSCKSCGNGERLVKKCGKEQNTQCECKDEHYRINKKSCARCINCSANCSHLCQTASTTPKTRTVFHPLEDTRLPLFAALFLMCGLIGGVALLKGVSMLRKRSRARSSQSPEAPDPGKILKKENCFEFSTNSCPGIIEENEKVPLSSEQQYQSLVLPDCIPKEVKVHEFIYFVMDQVPVSRFKELVRRLNVSEQDIDRAERDNRSFADAQYQMIKVWINNSTKGGNNVLPREHLQECVDRLKDMNLMACVESIEEEYCTDT